MSGMEKIPHKIKVRVIRHARVVDTKFRNNDLPETFSGKDSYVGFKFIIAFTHSICSCIPFIDTSNLTKLKKLRLLMLHKS